MQQFQPFKLGVEIPQFSHFVTPPPLFIQPVNNYDRSLSTKVSTQATRGNMSFLGLLREGIVVATTGGH